MTIDNVVFDLGNVLLFWDPLAVVREQLPRDSEHERIVSEVFEHPDWTELDRGSLDEEQANLQFAERTGRPVEKIRELILASKASLALIKETAALLEEVAAAGRRLFCLSNMSTGTFEFVHRRYSFFKKFDGILVSSYVGLLKPDPAIFQRLLDTYRLDPAATVLIDDRAENVEGARSVGIEGHVYRDAEGARGFLFD